MPPKTNARKPVKGDHKLINKSERQNNKTFKPLNEAVDSGAAMGTEAKRSSPSGKMKSGSPRNSPRTSPARQNPSPGGRQNTPSPGARPKQLPGRKNSSSRPKSAGVLGAYGGSAFTINHKHGRAPGRAVRSPENARSHKGRSPVQGKSSTSSSSSSSSSSGRNRGGSGSASSSSATPYVVFRGGEARGGGGGSATCCCVSIGQYKMGRS